MSEHENVGMTYEQAKEAIESAGQQEAQEHEQNPGVQSLRQSFSPDQATESVTPPEQSADEGTVEFNAPDVEEDSFMGSDFNPDLLPAELQPGWKQLQGAFTRKTQELAEQRKQFEELGDPDEIRRATDFFQSLNDPEYLQAFHQELGNVLQEMGLSPQEAAEAAQEITAEAKPSEIQLPNDLKELVASDPELSPLAQEIASLRSELDGFKQAQAAERQELELERQVMAQTAEIEQMVRVVGEQHPEYAEDDWQAIFDRAQAFDGNVLEAAERYEADKDRIIQSYLSSKPVPHSVTPVAGAGTATESTEKKPMTFEEADAAAQAWLSANDAEEFTG